MLVTPSSRIISEINEQFAKNLPAIIPFVTVTFLIDFGMTLLFLYEKYMMN